MAEVGKGKSQSIQPETVTLEISAGPADCALRAYFSSYHLWAARHFSRLTADIEHEPRDGARFDIRHRGYAVNTVLSATAFLEAAINELFQDAADGHESYVDCVDQECKQLLADIWQMTEGKNRSAFSLLDKFQLALTFLRKQKFDTGEQPFQNANLVVRLRNELVHYKPMSLGGRNEHKLVKQLRGKFPDNKLMDGCGNPWYPDKCLGHGCAEWTINSVVAFANAFFSRIGVKPNYQRIDWEAP